MAENSYWFARRFPVGDKRNAMVPITTEGWIVVAVFVFALVLGFGGLLFLGMNGQLLSGIALGILLVLGGTGMFLGMASRRGDKTKTYKDYRQGRAQE